MAYKSPIELANDLISPDEFLRVNKGKPYELIEGHVYEKTPTVGPHNKVYGHTYTPVVLNPSDQELKEYFIGEDGQKYPSWNDYAKLLKIGED